LDFRFCTDSTYICTDVCLCLLLSVSIRPSSSLNTLSWKLFSTLQETRFNRFHHLATWQQHKHRLQTLLWIRSVVVILQLCKDPLFCYIFTFAESEIREGHSRNPFHLFDGSHIRDNFLFTLGFKALRSIKCHCKKNDNQYLENVNAKLIITTDKPKTFFTCFEERNFKGIAQRLQTSSLRRCLLARPPAEATCKYRLLSLKQREHDWSQRIVAMDFLFVQNPCCDSKEPLSQGKMY
jgi:hypothetical protein